MRYFSVLDVIIYTAQKGETLCILFVWNLSFPSLKNALCQSVSSSWIPFITESFLMHRTAYKASQLHHDTGEYIKPKLSERFKVIDGHKVQRDLYSAFLICSTSSSLTIPDFEICNSSFPRFVEMHNILINNMKKRGFSMKQCFGF